MDVKDRCLDSGTFSTSSNFESLLKKKRKIKAFLESLPKEEVFLQKPKRMKTIPVNNNENSACESYMLKKQDELPTLCLGDLGFQAQVRNECGIENNSYSALHKPLYVSDIQELLLSASLAAPADCKAPRWCKIYNDQNLKCVLLIVLEGLSKDLLIKDSVLFKEITDFFDTVEIITPFLRSDNFVTELFGLDDWPDGKLQCISSNVKSTASSVPVFPKCTKIVNNEFSKLHLLLSPIQMIMENYPLPQNVISLPSTKDYCMTNDIYTASTPKSPMFAIDCEMCRTASGKMEVTRVAIVDENLDTLYDTLVKPKSKVIDYVTRFSGVTEEMLKPVTTTLDDVQQRIKEILPSDAILCGQSLNFDLHALKMIHPYVIDTSVIYNTTGCRTRKTGLRNLSQKFLKMNIQNSAKGHNPVEDCIATMKLVLLKLRNGQHFGDIILSEANATANKVIQFGETDSNAKQFSNAGMKICTNREPQNIPMITSKNETTVINAFKNTVFSKLLSQGKTACVIGNEKSLNQYSKELVSNVEQIMKASNKKIMKSAVENLTKYNLIVTHFQIFKESMGSSSLNKVNKWMNKLYNACSKNSLVLVFGTGVKIGENTFENGLCMAKIRC